ncbi:MAG: hypothetical protein N3B01_10010, partial [Verrucomicrobiae bacterium]|nr:hypothetical protein [Verrucomicrobiae bacterium]
TTYDQIVKSFQQTASAMKTINEKSKNIFTQTQDMAAIAQQLFRREVSSHLSFHLRRLGGA